MSQVQSLRLAQFWHFRIAPLLRKKASERPLFGADLFEVVGWLNEGVFCGHFNPRDTDVAWVRLRDTVAECPVPEDGIPESVINVVKSLLESRNPFREALQMPAGGQKNFELPLFPHALLIAKRFAADSLGSVCSASLWSSDEEWIGSKESWSMVTEADVLARLAGEIEPGPDAASLLAGFLRILEHMEASRQFFEYAEARARRAADFESYCQRIGALNAWRVPLTNSTRASRFRELSGLLEPALYPSLESNVEGAEWSTFEQYLSQHLRALTEAWETHHLAAFLVKP